MAQATVAPPVIRTLADLRKRLGGIALDRIWLTPPPGTATEKDVIDADVHKNRLCELVDGTLVEKAVGFEESRLAGRLMTLIGAYVHEHDLGICVGEAGMMRLAPGLVRIPDLSFIAWDRLPGRKSPRQPIPDFAPDLAVEVLSASNSRPEMTRKVREYFEAGVSVVWLIDPRKRIARVYSSPDRSILVSEDGTLDGGDILPGFTLGLADFFDRGSRARSN